MRRILIASLFISTVLLNAQTATKGQGVTLEASNSAPSAVATPAAAVDGAAAIPARRPSFGAIQPHLLSNPVANLTRADFNSMDPAAQQMVVHVELDAKGVPQSVQVVKPVNALVDQRILEAVSQYRFSPGMVDNVKVPSGLNLKINFNVQ